MGWYFLPGEGNIPRFPPDATLITSDSLTHQIYLTHQMNFISSQPKGFVLGPNKLRGGNLSTLFSRDLAEINENSFSQVLCVYLKLNVLCFFS